MAHCAIGRFGTEGGGRRRSACARTRRLGRSAAALRSAIRLKPDFSEAFNNRGILNDAKATYRQWCRITRRLLGLTGTMPAPCGTGALRLTKGDAKECRRMTIPQTASDKSICLNLAREDQNGCIITVIIVGRVRHCVPKLIDLTGKVVFGDV
jgi:hypothetical protein